MSLWHRILYWLGLRKDPGSQYYRVDDDIQMKLVNLAIQEGRTESEVIEEMIATGLQKRSTTEQQLQDWSSLSQREQDVTALVCLGYTNRQIAALMGVSTETVKTHLSNTLYKLNLLNRRQLRHLFSGWDFSAWQG